MTKRDVLPKLMLNEIATTKELILELTPSDYSSSHHYESVFNDDSVYFKMINFNST